MSSLLENREIRTVYDLLQFFPRAYENRTRIQTIEELKDGESATVAVQVLSSRKIPLRGRRKSLFEVTCQHTSGTRIKLKWFHTPWGMDKKFQPQKKMIVTGKVKHFNQRPEFIHPEISDESDDVHVGGITPIYSEIEGIPTRTLRTVLWNAIQKYLFTEDPIWKNDLPEALLKKYELPSIQEAILQIHFPKKALPTTTVDKLIEFNTPAHHRLIYEEFFKFELLVLKQRLRVQKKKATPIEFKSAEENLKDLKGVLPFSLTKDQEASLEEIIGDLCRPHPMNRLIQGDVGSGKTAIAFLSAACVLAEGWQAALMAPTEILADQHFQNALKLLGHRLNVALLTGKTPASERKALLGRLASGEPLLLIGTHALIEEPVQFSKLLFVLIDEQHRFGVEQRRTLRNKGVDQTPHTLILTATPIPRTLALTAYGDLSVSSIRELPPGRSPIHTEVVRESGRKKAIAKIRSELKAGRQAYFIFPLVSESEAEGFTHLKSAVAESENLSKNVFPEFKVDLLHGKLRADEKSAIMDTFKRGQTQVLVSTTVIEVGIDVPNATVIAIEHAERFGLSQLHQLRGRVGRGKHASSCFLFTRDYTVEASAQRLEVLEKTQNGFEIAEADLEIRGPGEFLGTRQAGSLPFRMANLVRDRKWLLAARDDALQLLKVDPEFNSAENASLKRYLVREGDLSLERLKTS